MIIEGGKVIEATLQPEKDIPVKDEGFQELQDDAFKKKIVYYSDQFDHVRKEVAKLVIGQDEVVNSLIEALLANGHVLVEGIPGVGKT
ncbi:hypothetical protein GOV10_05950, partial [Candidatus Woesearchaeota archaeon]|nr:hypothetical protein [Candidatus Woesearchaeota archaeon]